MRVLDRRLPGHLRISDVKPIEVPEPRVLLYVFSVILGPQSALRVGIEQAEDEVLGSEGEEVWELDDPFEYFFIDVSGFIIVVERRVACQELVNKNADAPIIHSFAVPTLVALLQHFWSQVFWSSANGEGPEVVQFFGESQVYQFGESFGVHHDILGFEVSEDDVFGVQVADGIQHSCHVEHRSVVVESAVPSQSSEQLSSLNILEHHVDVLGVLKGGLAASGTQYRATMLGWLISSRTSFSEWRCIS